MAEVAYLEEAVLNPEVGHLFLLTVTIYTLILLKHVAVALICMLYLTCFYFLAGHRGGGGGGRGWPSGTGGAHGG